MMDINLEPKTLKMLIGGLDRLITMATRRPEPSAKDLEDLEEMIARRDELVLRLSEMESPTIVAEPPLGFTTQDSSSTSATFAPLL